MDDPASSQAIAADIARVVVSRKRIAVRVRELAGRIAECYGQAELTILAVLTGSLIFLSDLIRQLPLKMRLDVVSVCSYPGQATRSQGPRIALPPGASLSGRHVLIVDDILDSGSTLRALQQAVALMDPASLRTCVLMQKVRPDVEDRPAADFVGFEVADEFLVGYGLDFDHLYRNLPDLCVLKPACYRRGAGATGREDA